MKRFMSALAQWFLSVHDQINNRFCSIRSELAELRGPDDDKTFQ